MLADKLRARVERVAELNRMLADRPDDKSAPDWISEISQKTLNRREERHLAVVNQIRRLRRRLEVSRGYVDDVPELEDRLARLRERPDFDRDRWQQKAKRLERLIANGGNYGRKIARIPELERTIEDLLNSPDLMTKEDVLDG